jgi:hypothetical protein
MRELRFSSEAVKHLGGRWGRETWRRMVMVKKKQTREKQIFASEKVKLVRD